MTRYNKLHLASQLLLSATREFEGESTDVDYVKCILLAGGIRDNRARSAPLLAGRQH